MLEKDIKQNMKYVITEFHEADLPPIYQRDISIPQFKHIHKAITFIGPRRAGKTYLLYQLIKNNIKNGVEKRDMLYLNFEDERLFPLKTEHLHLILEAYNELVPSKKPVLFFDEIQWIDGWEKFVSRLIERGYEIYLTGSNSRMLSSELSTSLAGRTYAVEVLPLSFKEFLRFKDVKLSKSWKYGKQRHLLKKYFEEYMLSSGFPEVVLEQNLSIVDDYLKTIFYRDLVERYRIKNTSLLHLLLHYIGRNYGREFSINKFHHFAKSSGITSSTSVIHSYIRMIEEVYYGFFMPSIAKTKSSLTYVKKAYLIDQGVANYLNPELEKGRLLENIFYLELKRRKTTPHFLKTANYECDFITKDCAFQVCYELTEHNKKRELKGLLTAMKNQKVAGQIITYDEEGLLKTDGAEVMVVPIWEFLLS